MASGPLLDSPSLYPSPASLFPPSTFPVLSSGAIQSAVPPARPARPTVGPSVSGELKTAPWGPKAQHAVLLAVGSFLSLSGGPLFFFLSFKRRRHTERRVRRQRLPPCGMGAAPLGHRRRRASFRLPSGAVSCVSLRSCPVELQPHLGLPFPVGE